MLNIYTLSWNGASKLEKLKNSLIPALEGIEYQWFIKDNNSSDNTKTVVSEWSEKNVNLINYKDNRQNFSQGMNYLYNHSSPKENDLVLLLNNDVEIGNRDSIKKMIANLKNDVGAVGSKLLYPDSNKLQHAGVVFIDSGMPYHFREGEIDDKFSSKNRYFQVITGAVMLTTAENYKNICTTNKSGNVGFDEEFIWAFDDVDACLSVRYRLGKKIVYCGETKIYHQGSATLKTNAVNKLFMQHNTNRLITKWKNTVDRDHNKYLKNNNYNLF